MPPSQIRTLPAIPYQLKPTVYSSHAAILRALPTEGAGRRVLDVGCSTGYLAEQLTARGFEVIGIEKSGGHSEDFPRGVRLIEHDLDLGLPDAAGRGFDYVICGDVLEHLRNPESLLSDAASRLQPNGRIIASLPNSGHAYFRWNILRGKFPQEDRGLFDRTHIRFYMWSGWVELFASSGLAIESWRPTSVPFGLAFPSLPHAFAEALEGMSVSLAYAWKTMFSYQFVVTAAKAGKPE